MNGARHVRLLAYRAAGTAARWLAVPFYLIDLAFDYLAKVVSVLCAIPVVPMVVFYDWCVKRHNALRALDTSEPRP